MLVRGTAQFSKLQDPSEATKIFKSKYSIDLFVDDAVKATLEGLGLKALPEKRDKVATGREYFRFWTLGINKKGELNPPVRVVDKFKNKILTEVGNGSDVTVQFMVFENKEFGTVSSLVQAVKVNEMRGGTADEFEYEEEEAPVLEDEVQNEFDDDVPY